MGADSDLKGGPAYLAMASCLAWHRYYQRFRDLEWRSLPFEKVVEIDEELAQRSTRQKSCTVTTALVARYIQPECIRLPSSGCDSPLASPRSQPSPRERSFFPRSLALTRAADHHCDTRESRPRASSTSNRPRVATFG